MTLSPTQRKAALELLNELDKISRQYDQWDYGLPLHGDICEVLIAEVLRSFERATEEAYQECANACDVNGDLCAAHHIRQLAKEPQASDEGDQP